MALDTYSGLVEAIGGWLNKGSTLDARIPDFIQLTESRLNKVLDDPQMEVTASTYGTGDAVGLPDDFGQMISINVGGRRVRSGTDADFSGVGSGGGLPTSFAIIDGQIFFAPAPVGTTDVTMVYRRRIPALTYENQSNWLLDLAPDAYLYGSLLHAEAYGWNDERLPTIKAFYDDAVDALREDASKRRWGAAPLAPRLGRT